MQLIISQFSSLSDIPFYTLREESAGISLVVKGTEKIQQYLTYVKTHL